MLAVLRNDTDCADVAPKLGSALEVVGCETSWRAAEGGSRWSVAREGRAERAPCCAPAFCLTRKEERVATDGRRRRHLRHVVRDARPVDAVGQRTARCRSRAGREDDVVVRLRRQHRPCAIEENLPSARPGLEWSTHTQGLQTHLPPRREGRVELRCPLGIRSEGRGRRNLLRAAPGGRGAEHAAAAAARRTGRAGLWPGVPSSE